MTRESMIAMRSKNGFSNNKEAPLTRYLITFCIITTGVTFLEGILGSIYYPEQSLDFTAFFVPPLYGFLTALTGLVTESRRTLSTGETVFRMALQLGLIELIVLGSNYLAGNSYTPVQYVIIALGVAAVFAFVYFMIWLNDRRIAAAFNKRLAELQDSVANDGDDTD